MSPDFAYPVQVESNARTTLDASLRKRDAVESLRAVMQIVIAENLVSRDNASRGLALIDSVAQLLPQPYNSLGELLKGKLLSDIYQADRWKYNNRVIPISPVPEDIAEWSKDIFASEVGSITSKAISNAGEAKNIDISRIASIITSAAEAEKAGLTVYDFMTIQACNDLSPFASTGTLIIPFGKVAGTQGTLNPPMPSELLERIMRDNLEWHSAMGSTQSGAVMEEYNLRNNPGQSRIEAIEKLVERFIDSPWCGSFLSEALNASWTEENLRDKERYYYDLTEEYLKRYPDCKGASALKSQLENMRGANVRISMPSQNLPAREMQGNVSFSNLKELYILALKVGEERLESSVTESSLLTGAKPVAVVKVSIEKDSTVPFTAEQKFKMPGLESGVYAIVASKTPDRTGIIRNYGSNATVSLMLVSRLSYFKTTAKKGESNSEWLYVTEGATGYPVAGAKVTFVPSWKGEGWKTLSLVTDKEGKVAVPKGSYKFTIRAGKDIIKSNIYDYARWSEDKRILVGSLLTDLSIYKPGDKIGFGGVVYHQKGQDLRMAESKEVKVSLMDANYQERDTLHLTTDKFGRLSGEFVVPADGLLGRWSLQMQSERNYIGQRWFEVAEYKTPTFYVVTSGTEGEVKVGETVRIIGEVKTYSGMPVSGAEIKYNVAYNPFYWLRAINGNNAEYGGKAVSGADGKFVIELPTESLKGTRYALGQYTLNVSATDGAGETQQAPATFFSLGSAYRISPAIPISLNADSPGDNISVRVYDMLNHPVKKEVYYSIISIPDSLSVDKGKFESGKLPVDFGKLRSGQYKVVFSLNSDMQETEGMQNETAEFILWRPTDRKPPLETPLWIPESMQDVATGSRNVEVKVGTSYPGNMIFAEYADMTGVYDREWIKMSDGMKSLTVKAPGDNNRVKVILYGMHDLKSSIGEVTLIPKSQLENVKITTESFRDRIVPGGNEIWRFRFTLADRSLADLPVMAVLSNNALNALAPFQWSFNPYGSLYWNIPANIEKDYIGNRSWSYRPGKRSYQRVDGYTLPEWETYGQGLYGTGGAVYNMLGTRIRGTAMMKSAAKAESASADVLVEEVENEVFDATAPAAGGLMENPVAGTSVTADMGNGSEAKKAVGEEETSFRELECPLAFFMPELTTDSDGVVTLDFRVPEYNGEWQLQLMGYTADMKGAVARMTAVSSRAVMVAMNAPRFARSGDILTVQANIFNNTFEALGLGGKIEFFNPLTSEVYLTKDFEDMSVDAAESRVIGSEFEIPSEINVLGIRVYGKGAGNSDGEQTVIPVYPSSTPVVESIPFWMAPGETEKTISLPQTDKGVTTLVYTDNPVWECLTAMPALLNPDSDNVLALSLSLYGSAVTHRLLAKYPRLREALALMTDPAMSGDSILVSNLSKNTSLKTVALNNTPWVRNAQSETLRMQSLVDYTDAEKSEKTLKDASAHLLTLQKPDGGWSWCEGMKSSEWITMQVVADLARLELAGFSTADCKTAARKGVAFIDSEIEKEWKKIGADKYHYSSLLPYLYIRSGLKDIKTSSTFNIIKNSALREIEKGWKSMDILSKAEAATLLWREGRKETAKAILLSLSEYASHNPEKGVWFDNLRSGSSGVMKLRTTVRVLEACHEIDPSMLMIDGLRQWLLLSKQVEDWGGGETAADVVSGVLQTGSEWTGEAKAPRISIGDQEMEIDKIAALTGSLTISLTGQTGDLRINRDASGPAWGGVVNQFVALIEKVKADGNKTLSIVKNLYTITDDKEGTEASKSTLKVGDKVRVTLTLKCDRDLQYVAVTDSRAACLEPADQTSGYTSSDGVWMYKEVRSNSTNLFIPFLPKGTHVVTYDCYVDRAGEYSLGIATAQSQYAPEITAHSGGERVSILKN